ncbi:MAG: hypothetical protein IJV29_09075 [Butyrivibrio sp.]|jgi:hypothetical protein|nr:hypothetical protein [Butyrivibrio sp.]
MYYTTRKYTANEVISLIRNGWKSEEELRDLFEFVSGVDMSDSEREKLRVSNMDELVFRSYRAS